MALNELVDAVPYAEASNVERYIRNQTFDATSDPTLEEVKKKLMEASEKVDTKTNRAWRMRRVADRELRVKFTHKQQKRARTRRNLPHIGRTRGRAVLNPVDPRGVATLPHTQIQPIESAENDKIEVLLPRSVEDITANEGRDVEDGWVLDERHGILHVDVENYLRGPIWGSGLVQHPKVRVNYRYGQDESGNDVSQSVPDDVRQAVAKLVAADLIQSDQYGSMHASGLENTPDQGSAADQFRESALETVGDYRYRRRL